MILPMQYKNSVRLHRIDTYDEYLMFYEYLKTEFYKKKAGRVITGWQIANGKIPFGDLHVSKMRVIT